MDQRRGDSVARFYDATNGFCSLVEVPGIDPAAMTWGALVAEFMRHPDLAAVASPYLRTGTRIYRYDGFEQGAEISVTAPGVLSATLSSLELDGDTALLLVDGCSSQEEAAAQTGADLWELRAEVKADQNDTLMQMLASQQQMLTALYDLHYRREVSLMAAAVLVTSRRVRPLPAPLSRRRRRGRRMG